jgi:hypothetical protein
MICIDNASNWYTTAVKLHIQTIEGFLGRLEYQHQFRDHRMLDMVEREGAQFLRLAKNCLSCKCRSNSSRFSTPTTWDRETSNAMYYRSRPRTADVDT